MDTICEWPSNNFHRCLLCLDALHPLPPFREFPMPSGNFARLAHFTLFRRWPFLNQLRGPFKFETGVHEPQNPGARFRRKKTTRNSFERSVTAKWVGGGKGNPSLYHSRTPVSPSGSSWLDFSVLLVSWVIVTPCLFCAASTGSVR